MKIILIHGDDIVSSRNSLADKLSEKKSGEIIHFDQTVTLTDLVSTVESPSLFSTDKTVVIEKILAGVKSKAKTEILSYLTNVTSPFTIIFWEGDLVDKRTVNAYFSKAEVLSFSLPKLLFQFLETIGRDASGIVPLHQKLLKTQDEGLIYAMVLRQWQYLIIAKDLGAKGFGTLSPWMTSKYLSQARFFTLEELIGSYRKLLAIDYNIKTGATPFSYSKLLDIFLASL